MILNRLSDFAGNSFPTNALGLTGLAVEELAVEELVVGAPLSDSTAIME